MSQLGMARLVGVQASWWGRLEADARQPSRAMVERIADGLDLGAVERDRLLVAAGYSPAWVSDLYADWPAAAIRRLMARVERGGAA
jgi:transcriptional regulator with XRE-family HTH domain